MKITYKQLIEAKDAIRTIASKELSISEAVKSARLVAALSSEYDILSKQMRALYDKYAKKDENGNMTVAPDKREEFNKKYNELLSQEAQITCDKVRITSEIKLDTASVLLLESFFSFTDDEVDEVKEKEQ